MFGYIPFPVFTHTTGMTHFQFSKGNTLLTGTRKETESRSGTVGAFRRLTNRVRRARATTLLWIVIPVPLAVHIFTKQAKDRSVTGLGVQAAANGRTNTVILLTLILLMWRIW